jgi:hypothetical protein
MSSIISAAGGNCGGGVLNFQTGPTLRNLIIKNNTASKGGGMYNMSGSGSGPYTRHTAATLENVTIENNTATARGGGMSNDYSDPTMTNVKFISNSTTAKGGGMYNDWDANPTITNCLFVSNSAERAGAIGNDGSSDPVITNCTFTKNHANDIGAGLYQGSGNSNDPVVKNSIFWGNTLSYNGPRDISNFHETEAHITYSIIEEGHVGTGNLTSDPMFVDAANGDYSLSSNSPAINTGTDTGISATDLIGNSRVGTTDMGAYEYQGSPTTSTPTTVANTPTTVATTSTSTPTTVVNTSTPTPSANTSTPTPPGGTSTASTSTPTPTSSSSTAYNGYNLYAPFNTTNTYLMDNNGNTVFTWASNYKPAHSVYLLEDGSLLQTGNVNNSKFGQTGGAGGIVQKIASDGTVTWSYQYSSDTYLQHHDVEPLPNGNVLLVAWQVKTQAEATAAGRDSSKLKDGELWPDSIIEVDSTGTIVWEWHVWDHLIQDFDSSKSNYGTVASHPELINLNFIGDGTTGADWNHVNSVDYNAEFNQILISAHNFSEIWIIDHSTTTAQAASHSGGNRGKGGDLLYRWGNPQAYGAGSATDQKFFVQHDAEWIPSGYPGAGNITVFNNGKGRSDGDYSSVDEFTPAVNSSGNYTAPAAGAAYGPTAQTWTYNLDTSLYAERISGAQRLPNGNTLICSGTTGTFLEVNSAKTTVWSYTVANSPSIFRVTRYGTDYAGLPASVKPTSTPTAQVTSTPTAKPTSTPTSTPTGTVSPTSTPAYTAQPTENNPLSGIDTTTDCKESAMGDVDADGDSDLVCLKNNGAMLYYKNVAGTYEQQKGADNPFRSIDGSGFNSLELSDWDGDNDADLIVGLTDGTISYFENAGSYQQVTATPASTTVPATNTPAPTNTTIPATNTTIPPTTATVPATTTPTAAAPQAAVQACSGKALNDACTFTGQNNNTVSGTCQQPQGTLTCVPPQRLISLLETTGVPSYTEKTGDGNPFNGIDVGDNAAPVIIDVNGDGKPDLATGNKEGKVKYHQNNGAGGLDEKTGAGNPFGNISRDENARPAIGDVDGDGKPDIIIGGPGGPPDFFRNPGDGTEFKPPLPGHNPLANFPPGMPPPHFVDINGDGKLELVVQTENGFVLYSPTSASALNIYLPVIVK